MPSEINQYGRELRKHGTDAFPCATYHTENSGFPLHWHEELEMIYVLEGKLFVTAGDQRYLLEAGDAISVNSGIPHELIPDGAAPYAECDVVFHPRLVYGGTDSVLWEKYLNGYLHNTAFEGVALRRRTEWSQAAAQRIKRAYEAFNAGKPYREFAVREEVTGVLLAILQNCPAQPRRDDRAYRHRTELVKGMILYLEEHMDEDVRMERLADFVHLSTRECQRSFQEAIGTTPMRHLNQMRLNKAAQLLRTEKWTVTEIGELCGYKSPSYFAKQFRWRYGTTPNKFREQWAREIRQ